MDDEEFCLNATKKMLIKAGIKPELLDFCIDGEEYLKTIRNADSLGVTYSLIFTDFSMPKLNGIEATQQVIEYLERKRLAVPTIVGVTGHCQKTFIDRGIEAGMRRVVSKPLYFEILNQILKETLPEMNM